MKQLNYIVKMKMRSIYQPKGLENFLRNIFAALLVVAMSSPLCAQLDFGPGEYPPPGGVTFLPGGSASAGDAGGRIFNFSNFDPSAYETMFWGPAASDAIQASLNGNLTSLTFQSISANVANWSVTIPGGYNNPTTGNTSDIRIDLRLTLLPAGALWTPDLDLGAIFEIVGGADFSVRLEFLATDLSHGSFTNLALNQVQQAANSQGLTQSSFSGGFLGTIVLIPTMGQWALFLLALMITSLGLVYIRKQKLAV